MKVEKVHIHQYEMREAGRSTRQEPCRIASLRCPPRVVYIEQAVRSMHLLPSP